MLTAMLAVRNVLGANYDLWEVNADEDYHEEIGRRADEHSEELTRLASTQPGVPRRLAPHTRAATAAAAGLEAELSD
jgi:hypothetical protein